MHLCAALRYFISSVLCFVGIGGRVIRSSLEVYIFMFCALKLLITKIYFIVKVLFSIFFHFVSLYLIFPLLFGKNFTTRFGEVSDIYCNRTAIIMRIVLKKYLMFFF